MTSRTLRVAIGGAGHVGTGLLRLLGDQARRLENRFGLRLAVVAVVDLGGAVVEPGGIDLGSLGLDETDGYGAPFPETVRHALAGHVSWRPGFAVSDVLDPATVDVYVEATPLDVTDAQPALAHVTKALDAGCHVVTANKGPLALAFPELAARSDVGAQGPAPCLRFSACVAGALPVLNVGARDLGGEPIERFEGVLNGTSHWVLQQMAVGHDFATALAEAQRMGIAEADPTLDVSGLDAACKLVIVANAVFGLPCRLPDVARRGINELDPAELRAAAETDRIVLPLARVVRGPDATPSLDVGPHSVERTHPLATLRPSQMGAVFATAAVPELVLTSDEPSALPASAALLRDLLDIHRTTSR